MAPPTQRHGRHGRPVQKPKNAKKTIKRLLKYLAFYKFLFVFVFLCIIISSGANVASSYFLQPILNDYIVPAIGSKSPDLSGFVFLLSKMALIFALGSIAGWANNRIMIHISSKTLYKLRTELFAHMEMLPLRYFDSHTHGELMSHFTNDIDAIRDMLSQAVPQLFSSLLTVVACFVMMLSLSPVLTLVVVLTVVAMIAVTGIVGKYSAKAFRSQQESIGKVNGYIEEIIEGQKVVKVFCREETSKIEFDSLNDMLCKAGTKANTLANILAPLMNNMGHISYAFTAIMGVMFIIAGKMDLGRIASFLEYSRSFKNPITQMAQMFNGVLNALAGAERVFAVIDEETEVDEGYVTLVNANILSDGSVAEAFFPTGQWAWKHPHHDNTVSYVLLKGEVQFENVTFGYEKEKTVLHNITMTAHPGEKIALVGSTGSGKTTITNLINRFYDASTNVDGGSKIRFDGININKIKKADLRRSLGIVLQDTHLFTGSIADNIRFGKLDASMQEVETAAKLANADYFIRHLHQGYETIITGDGESLSQGQRQLLAIARAAVANPPVLILDEATSSVDTRTESLIEKGMDSLMQGRTVFVIAHRLSTVRNADKIIVLEHGRIIENGSHDELIAQKGRYYKLYTGSFAS